MTVFKVYVRFDDDAQVWYVHDSNVPGLHAESGSLDELRVDVLALIPELLKANGVNVADRNQGHKSVPFDLIAQQRNHTAVTC
jgi:hypothetical protein